ncbi:RDD family protein [Mucilaginibacter achroorhodeus]|uniref:RDD family protein n=1 Tax=Mucilaginibacter achroorhodeus TaxID=2599294 RepID=A0A563UAF8_9SPHI|nr:RDD family protein [Mucilaginibacter achroorhodeus]TWR28371.1 RDD family protein [Mucilaginibacter achroorhodeus]
MQTGNSFPDPSEADNYILVIDGKPQGPFTIAELRQHNIKPGDFVKTDAMIDYKEAHEIPALRELLGFQRRPLTMQYFGSFDQRAIAAVVDWLLVFAVFVLAAFVVMLMLYIFIPGEDNKMLRMGIIMGIVSLTPVAKFFYNVKLESGPKQGTIGKQLLRIRVCDVYGDRLTTSKALTRNAAKIISTAIFFIGYLLCFFNSKQQCLHDMIADTLTIRDRLDE